MFVNSLNKVYDDAYLLIFLKVCDQVCAIASLTLAHGLCSAQFILLCRSFFSAMTLPTFLSQDNLA